MPKEEVVSIDELHFHPRNYRSHPQDQIEHLKQSIQEHGVYRRIVIAKDSTILAGHGVIKAAIELGFEKINVVRLDIGPNDPKAIKLMVADNELSHLSISDDRALTELLKETSELDVDGLLGTGYDQSMLANLAFVTRPRSEVKNVNHAAEWAGMPEYENEPPPLKASISFRNSEDRSKFCELLGIDPPKDESDKTISAWFPAKDNEDLASVRFEG